MNGGLEISYQNRFQIMCKTWLVYPPRHTKDIAFDIINRLCIIDGMGINYKIVSQFKRCALYTRKYGILYIDIPSKAFIYCQ